MLSKLKFLLCKVKQHKHCFIGLLRYCAEEIESISHPIPALGDGFLPIGSPEDTLATVYGMPKAIRSSKTVLRHQNRLLRARVRQLTRNKIDSSRSFQLSFFLEDNTLQIFEEVTRNSGIVGGR